MICKYLYHIKIKDFDCEFKLMTRTTAKLLIPKLHLYDYGYSIELIYLCNKYNIPIKEVYVNENINKNKRNFYTLQCIRDSIITKICYTLKIW